MATTGTKVIWIVNQYASSKPAGTTGRHHYIASSLAAKGHKVRVIAGRYSHLAGGMDAAAVAAREEQVEGYSFCRINTLRYQHAHDKKRVLNWFIFAFKLAFFRLGTSAPPEVIICSTPSLVSYLGAAHLARRFNAKLVVEVRDFWPRTLIMLGGYSERHPLIALLAWIERKAYKRADHLVSNMPEALNHLRHFGVTPERFTWVANGFCLADAERAEPLSKDVAEHFSGKEFVVGYTGSLGLANSMDTLLEAARILAADCSIRFVIIGEGKDKPRLQALAQQWGLQNVTFVNAIPKLQVPAALALCDATFIAWKNSPLYDTGIAANKLYDYLYAGKPILHCYSGSGDPVSQYNAGLTVPAENPQALAAAIHQLKSMPDSEQAQLGENGRVAALKFHEYEQLAARYENLVNGLCG